MMPRYQKVSLTVLSLVLLVGTVAMIGWIGFQERFRLLELSFRKDAVVAEEHGDRTEAENKLADHTVIETAAEADAVVTLVEKRLRDLESDDLPEE